MSGFFAWFLKNVLIDFLWEKIRSGVSWIVDWFREKKVRDEIVRRNDDQAAVVEAVAESIKALLKEKMNYVARGEEPPPLLSEKLTELYEKLKIESRKISYRADVG